jgi:hypothetical protein
MAATMLVTMAGLIAGSSMVMVGTGAFVQVATTTPQGLSFVLKKRKNSPCVFGFGASERTTTVKRQANTKTKTKPNARFTRLCAADADSFGQENDFAKAMTAYMAKTHEEKLETQTLMAAKDAEIEVRLSYRTVSRN